MARINQGILGPILGSLGNVVGCIRYGVPYLRTKPLTYNDAKNPAQLAQRARRIACIELYRSLRFTIGRPIWNKMAHKMSGYNLFMKANIMNFDGDGKVFDFENLKFSVGDLPIPENIAVHPNPDGNGAVIVSWTDNSGYGSAAPTDRLRIVTFYDNTMNELQGLTFTRKEQYADIQLPFSPGEEVHLYFFFQNKDGSEYSESIHLPVRIPATAIRELVK
jgi:hypothetical protein